MRSAIFCILLCSFTGCAHTAVVTCLEPAEIDVAGMNRIAVADFSGEQGEAIAAVLSNRLWENRFYTVVDRSELTSEIQTASYSEGSSLQGVLAAAHQANVDGVIVGNIIEYRCDDLILGATDIDVDIFNQADSENNSPQANSTIDIDFNQVVRREGSVTIAFRLVDVETGEIRAAKQVSKNYQGEQVNDQGNLPTQGEVLQMLTGQCLDEVVKMLAPHETACEMKFASCDFWTKGSASVRKGLKAVEKGDWNGAENHWTQAIQQNPKNHAAMFNLSIAAARRQEYDIAEQYVLDALKLEHKTCYTTGLEKIRERRTAWTRAIDQRDARVVTAAESLWQ